MLRCKTPTETTLSEEQVLGRRFAINYRVLPVQPAYHLHRSQYNLSLLIQ